MPQTLFALIRYNVIDRCLRDKEHIYRWRDLAEKCRQEIMDKMDIDRLPSQRTINYDISNMRSGKLGYEAPIAYSKERGYYYSIPGFSINNVIFDRNTVNELKSALNMLDRFMKSNNLWSIQKALVTIRDKMNIDFDDDKYPAIILEQSTNIKGILNLDRIYKAVKQKQSLTIRYLPFDNSDVLWLSISPYFIKEFNNRWFVIAYDHNNKRLTNLALDRIEEVKNSLLEYNHDDLPYHDAFYENVYGVTIKRDSSVEHIVFFATPLQSKYLISKPIHKTQKLIETSAKGSTFSLDLIVNYEIIHRLLSYGDTVEVLEPLALREKIALTVSSMYKRYRLR